VHRAALFVGSVCIPLSCESTPLGFKDNIKWHVVLLQNLPKIIYFPFFKLFGITFIFTLHYAA
jgi:hypothetical protein